MAKAVIVILIIILVLASAFGILELYARYKGNNQGGVINNLKMFKDKCLGAVKAGLRF